jgi:outer membrane protein, heavy metal efflux system
MKKIVFILMILLPGAILRGQNAVEEIVDQVAGNHTGLKALQMQIEAQTVANRTGIFLPNPELEYEYYLGNPSDLGNKVGLSIKQHFLFPSAYRYMSRIANSRNDQLQTEYNQHLLDVKHEIRMVVLSIIHHNSLLQLHETRLNDAVRIEQAYSRMLEAGQTNILEYNKARLSVLDLRKANERIAISRNALLDDLTRLNGGTVINVTATSYPLWAIDEDFSQWYARAEEINPRLIRIKQEVEISREQEKLQKALNLPSFSAGYVSEVLAHEQFRGVAAGITIPLWENKNTLRYARANTQALQGVEHDLQVQYYNHLRSVYNRLISLNDAVSEYREVLGNVDNSRLLNIALEHGEITLTGYINELTYFYTSTDRLLEMELERQQAFAELMKYML